MYYIFERVWIPVSCFLVSMRYSQCNLVMGNRNVVHKFVEKLVGCCVLHTKSRHSGGIKLSC